MRVYATGLSLAILLAASGAWSQSASQSQVTSSTQRVAEATSPDYAAVYCSNFVSSEKVADDMRLISGEESNSKVVFARGDYVYLSKGAAQGVHVGDRFAVVRPDKDPVEVKWFKWQDKLLKAMGSVFLDTGQVRVVTVQPNVSIAEVTFSCGYMQRGDIVVPMQERPSPPYKPAATFEHFAPPSGKSVGMLVVGKDFSQLYGKNSTVYVNLGASQGVKVGDYYRVFRYQGTTSQTLGYFPDYQYKLYGFGSTPKAFKWNDLPREVLGEGIVIRTGPNSSTMFITYSTQDMYAGDYVEIE